MTTLDQVPFGNMEFADNPEPHCACLLLLDTSESMQGMGSYPPLTPSSSAASLPAT